MQGADIECCLDTAATQPAAIPVLVWFLARVVRQVKAVQEGFAMQCAAEDLEVLGYAIRRSDLSSPAYKSWHLRLASYLCGTLLFGSHAAYEIRLQGTRWGSGVHLEQFRRAIGHFLAEWRGASNVRSMVGSWLSCLLHQIDSNLLVRRRTICPVLQLTTFHGAGDRLRGVRVPIACSIVAPYHVLPVQILRFCRFP